MKLKTIIFTILIINNVVFSQNENEIELTKIDVNSELSDVSTDFVDGTLFFYRNKSSFDFYSNYYDLYKVQIDKAKITAKAERLDNNINSIYNEGPASIDEKAKLVYVTRNKFETKKSIKKKKVSRNLLEILVYKITINGFEYVRDFEHNDSSYSVGHGFFSNYSNRLYFASDAPGGYGEIDLYYCTKNEDGSFSEPINLGADINTKGKDYLPYVKEGMLYFSSNGLNPDASRTDMDIYAITELGVGRGETPKNIGAPFNSTEDDLGVVLIDNKSGYLTTSKGNEVNYNHDIYYFNMVNPIIKDNQINLLLVVDSNKIPRGEFKDIVVKKSNNILEGKVVNEGLFFERINADETISISYPEKYNYRSEEVGPYERLKKNDFFREELLKTVKTTLLASNVKDGITTNKENTIEKVKTEKIPTPENNNTISIDDIYFKYDSDILYDESKVVLDKIINDYMINDKFKMFSITAHTDSRGDRSYNLGLSMRRALAIQNYIVSKGVSAAKIKGIQGVGSSTPAVTCNPCTEAQHKLNRRVEFKFE